ncbi:hypothetical protein [Desulfosarcina variabilis]|uniref:hypothetical protein n=1 Tax=Desulfosarcina variabilis TaxID=2300 RepID=UPI003AFA8630
MPENQIEKRKDDMQDYMHVMLSVLSQENAESSDCPDPEDLAAFTEGRLKGNEHKAIMAHLNDCTACRRHWLMIQSVLEEMSFRKVTWKEKILHTLKKLTPRRIFTGAGIGIAVATCLVLVVTIPQKDKLPQMISRSYMNLSSSDIARYNSFVSRGDAKDLGQFQPERMSESRTDTSPNEIDRYDSFADDDKDKAMEKFQPQLQPQFEEQSQSDALMAFKAGIAQGRARLLSQTKTTNQAEDQEALSSPLNSLGRWAVLLQCACISEKPVSETFWSDQEMIALKLHDDINQSATGEIEKHIFMQTVMTIKNTIGQIRESGQQANGCEDIKTAINSLENHLYSTPTLLN